MRFTLTYDGPLHIGNKAPGKQHVRAHLHPQVRQLWDFPPLAGDATAGMLTWQGQGPSESGERGLSVLTEVKGQILAPLVCSSLKTVASLDVLFLRPGKAGVLAGQGDIDNRLKVLFDALSVPAPQMAENVPCPPGLGTKLHPFHTLLEDDERVTAVNVDTDRLLGDWPHDHVRAIVRVDVRPAEFIFGNLAFL